MQGKHWTYGENGNLKMENWKSGEMRLTQSTLRTPFDFAQGRQRAESKREKRRRKSGEPWGMGESGFGRGVG
jgi:hypothetical protein